MRDLSFAPVENSQPRVLTAAQIESYNEHGYLKPFRIFDEQQARANREYFDWLLDEVSKAGDGRDQYSINGYHTQCAKLWDIVTEPRILDTVQDLLGANFVCWGTHFFAKLPHDAKAVPFHQDASYWPLNPACTVTVWLAIDDADKENAAMMFIPGTHRRGHLKWRNASTPAVLNQEIENVEQFGEPVYDELKAGEMSLHADMLAHGSMPNPSNRRRCGLTIRYCPTSVSAGESGWNRDAILCRGKDETGHWVHNARPHGENTDPRSWQREATALAAG
jgi:hypothetical protein